MGEILTCLEELDEEQAARWQLSVETMTHDVETMKDSIAGGTVCVSESGPLIPRLEAVFFVPITDLVKTEIPADTHILMLYKFDVEPSSTCFLTLTQSSLCS